MPSGCRRERGVRLVQLLDRLQNPKPDSDGTLSVVLVCDRRSEDGHHRVTDELLDRAAVALDLLPQTHRNSPGSSLPQDGQADTRAVYGGTGRFEGSPTSRQPAVTGGSGDIPHTGPGA
jgi:hypothetical protein